ncbi:MAG: DUF1772 domain-containing protein [Rhodospirillales bacterium]|nr:DUF1772 domain-containing protein [Rhodospirillales bacterium]
MSHAVFVLILAAAIGCGLVAGIFFAFSSFVMAALGRLPSDHGIAAMNAINVTVINPLFMLAFFGTAALCLAASAGVALRWTASNGMLVLLASVIYLVGCIGVTMLRNVPLNNALAVVTPGTPEAAALWTRYLSEWTFWNTVRTVAPIVSAVLFTAALIRS